MGAWGGRRVGYGIAFAALLAAAIVAGPTLAKLDFARFPSRESWQLPDRVVEALDVRPGDRVADLGAGEGYFTFRLAEAVGPNGLVYAVDVSEGALRGVERGIEAKASRNVEVVLAEATDARLPDGEIDLVFLCNVYHHIDERVRYFRALLSDLSPRGRVAVVEVADRIPVRWLVPRGHWTPLEDLTDEMARAGYRAAERFHFLPVQEFVIFERGLEPSSVPR